MLKRYKKNPILTPSKNPWESRLVSNPAAIYLGGKIHLLYTAWGKDRKVRLGYASTSDGLHIDERLDQPIFYPQEKDFEDQGTEDPRLTLLGNKIYLTYTAKLTEKGICRPAISSISQKDFLAKNWNWSEHRLLLPEHIESNRNVVIFPEKIKGKYVMYHRPIFLKDIGSIWVAYSYDLKHWFGHKKIAGPRPGMWDDAKIGAGPPPIKLKDCWLLIYHGVHKRDWSYSLGVMLIALDNPEEILYRSDKPILRPEKDYELRGTSSKVVFSCGAVLVNTQLFVYYGAADKVIGVSTTAPITDFWSVVRLK